MAFQYDLFEDEIVVRLSGSIANREILALPDKQALLKDVFDNTRIIVAYGGSEFMPSKSTNESRQDETVSIVCNIQSRKLRGENGIYQTIEEVKKYLTGWKPTVADRLMLKSVDFEERNTETNVWSYNVIFSARKLHVQFSRDDQFDGPLLREVILVDKVQTP